ncbi:MAG: roadblock/LC7 domain-containing protein [Syntrophotaleaceae bacterium]
MFTKILQNIVEESDGYSAVLMGYDGLAVAHYDRLGDAGDLNLFAVEYANVLKEMKDTVSILNTGAIEEVTVKTERFQVIIRALNEDYFVILTLACNGNYGKGRYLLSREAFSLREELR